MPSDKSLIIAGLAIVLILAAAGGVVLFSPPNTRQSIPLEDVEITSASIQIPSNFNAQCGQPGVYNCSNPMVYLTVKNLGNYSLNSLYVFIVYDNGQSYSVCQYNSICNENFVTLPGGVAPGDSLSVQQKLPSALFNYWQQRTYKVAITAGYLLGPSGHYAQERSYASVSVVPTSG